MLFTEPIFLFAFLPLVLAVYFASPRRARNFVLIAATLIFYAWGQKLYVLVLIGSIVLNYSFGRAIERVIDPKRRRTVFWFGLGANLLLLAAFKYSLFVIVNIDRGLNLLHGHTIPKHVNPIPLGLSFFSLMGMSYLIDSYRDGFAEKRFGRFAGYLAFFPYVSAGPIVRYGTMAAQLAARRITLENFAAGVRRVIIGLAKKLIIANTIGITVDTIFTNPFSAVSASAAWLGAGAFALQIYFDIAGYADIAIGLGLMFGFHLPENFNYPYIAQSLTDFWQRWHITLVQWFRDYLFFPLSFRQPRWRIYLNLILVFVLCGLWHEGSWKFLAWGLAHGSLLALERIGLAEMLLKLPRVLRHAYVILAIVITSVLVRARSLSDALRFFGNMIGINAGRVSAGSYPNKLFVALVVIAIFASIPLVPIFHRWHERAGERLSGFSGYLFDGGIAIVKLAALVLLFIAAVSFAAVTTYKPFIYFQF